ncbi:hypothetical protein F4680DRAFT_193300 [Xylaria scruposa]|nr:hypothetical protein F4680DRAFT_193300 [Xylaria scruposa]
MHDTDSISRLSNEILLKIFEDDLTTTATLASCATCCKRWSALATSVLYRHVALTGTRKLSRWIAAAPESPPLSSATESLTIYVTKDWDEDGPDSDANAMEQVRQDLDRLPARLRQMARLRSFSIFTPEGRTPASWAPSSSVEKILQAIPANCSSLEVFIDGRLQPADDSSEQQETSHLCISIRQLLPQLQYLRLALPCLCPESFGSVSAQTSAGPSDFVPADAPELRECIIRLASPFGGGDVKRFDGPCNPGVSISGVEAFVKCLLTMVDARKMPLIEKLWVCDALPKIDIHANTSYGAFVRRDVLTKKSHTFPWNRLPPHPVTNNYFLVRMPGEEGGEDLLATKQGAEFLVERCGWMTAGNGSRLPASLMHKYRLPRQESVVQTREEWSASCRKTTQLWKNETTTGMRLLEGETGDLLEDRPAELQVPEGWRWDEFDLGFLEKDT